MDTAMRSAMLTALFSVPTMLLVLVAAPTDSPVADTAMRGDAEAIRTLLTQGADVQTAQADGMTALHWAAMQNDLEIAETLIYAGANLEAVTRIGQHSPLHVASKSGHATLVKVLLTAGSTPHATTTSGTTPLHLAARSGNGEAVAALLDHGADVNARESTWGQTPLMFAAAYNRIGPVNVLMERGANYEAATNVVDLPVVDAVDRAAARRRQEVLDGFRAAVQPHEQQGWQPSASQVQSAILAAREVQASSTTAPTEGDNGKQLSRGTPRAYTERVGTQGGMTALLHAARQGHTEVAMALLYAGADVNRVSGDGTSPLQIATMNGHFDLALRLVERGADPNIATDAGATPLFAALNLQWAPRARYPQPRAHDQQEATYLELMKILLEVGARPNARLEKHLWYMSYNHCCSESVDGATPFWRAAYATDVEAMKLLVAYGADPNIPTRAPEPRGRNEAESDPSGLPHVVAGGPGVWPIHAASGVGYGEGFESNSHRHVPDGWLASVKYLVEELDVDVNMRDHDGYNAVHHAAARGHTDMVRYLVEQGADVMTVSRRGQTTADMANGPYQRTLPFPDTLAVLETLGAVNNHNCVSC